MSTTNIKKLSKFLPDRDRVRLLKLSGSHTKTDADVEEISSLIARAEQRASKEEGRSDKARGRELGG